jgi:hypothetical protein
MSCNQKLVRQERSPPWTGSIYRLATCWVTSVFAENYGQSDPALRPHAHRDFVVQTTPVGTVLCRLRRVGCWGLGDALLGNQVLQPSLEYAGLPGEGSSPVPLAPPSTMPVCCRARSTRPQNPQQTETFWVTDRTRDCRRDDNLRLETTIFSKASYFVILVQF